MLCDVAEELVSFLGEKFHGNFHGHWFHPFKIFLNSIFHPLSMRSCLKLSVTDRFRTRILYVFRMSFTSSFPPHPIVLDLTTSISISRR
jgi:hypothetical protein